MKKTTDRRKPKYGLLSCVGYIYRLLWRYERHLAWVGFLTVPVTVGLSALALYTTPAILSALERYGQFSPVALILLGLVLAKLLLDEVNLFLTTKTGNAEIHLMIRLTYILKLHQHARDPYLQYDPQVRKLDQRAHTATQNNHSACAHFPMDFAAITSQALCLALFGSVVFALHPAVIVLLVAGCTLNALFARWERRQNYDDRPHLDAIDQKLDYLAWDLAGDLSYGKDVRLYRMRQPLLRHLTRDFEQDYAWQKKLKRRSLRTAVAAFAFDLVRDGAAYAFLIHQAVAGRLDAAAFVLYFSAIGSLADALSGVLGRWNRVLEGGLETSDYRQAMEEKGRMNHGEGAPLPQGPFSIEFRHVSYRYPEGEKTVLQDISFTIAPGEKVALVGLNGAGKTTLTLLACGLLLPDEGQILLDGQPLESYNRDEMYSLFGLVPQTHNILPSSIAQNITCRLEGEAVDEGRLAHCLQVAGLAEKVAALPKGADTPLDRQLYPDGIALSGGEVQKLLLARLLYKAPPCIILDEPTAALDPIAEDRMYRRYNEIAVGATALFISHRLASTRFCDRIFLLDGARFAEVGTHEQLMAAGGKYRQLFDIQSKYYKEGAMQDAQA